MHTMTDRKGKSGTIEVKALLAGDEEFLRALVRTALQEVLEAEMTEALGPEKSERTAGRLGYRSGYYGRICGDDYDGRPCRSIAATGECSRAIELCLTKSAPVAYRALPESGLLFPSF
jgi:Transposase, Mutator family